MTLSLSLIVCTYRRPGPVRRLLDAVAAQTCRPDEVLVVDASLDADTEEAVRGLGVTYERVPPEERGLTRQRNWGIARVRGDVIAFLDDDTVPEPGYFAEVLACFERHPDAVGVGGYIFNEVDWRRAAGQPSLAVYRNGGWERREDFRWRLRRLSGLDSPLPPGRMPASGHGRPTGFIPPDGEDHPVELFMGGAAAWRRELLERVRFSPWFEGYGLYEDMDFCLRAGRHGSLWLCTRARLAHLHDAAGRPHRFRYGEMVVRNGWRVWRLRWPSPPWPDRGRWWATTLLLALCRLGDAVRGPERTAAFSEALGRFWGSVSLLWDRPEGDA
ncbi:MAG: glycosyltransferase family 2 protein [Thermoanaerobaculia bacterium]